MTTPATNRRPEEKKTAPFAQSQNRRQTWQDIFGRSMACPNRVEKPDQDQDQEYKLHNRTKQ